MSITIDKLPRQDVMVRNIVGCYYTAGERDLENGANWYERTREWCQLVADRFGYPLQNVVGAYAVISPTLTKEKNDEAIEIMCDYHRFGLLAEFWPPVGVYGIRNRLKAERCLNGDLSAVAGPKVSAFFRNIMGYDNNIVTVDRWAVRVALNDPLMDEKDAIPSGKKVNHAIGDAYRKAAEYIGQNPMVVQSVTWETMRNEYFAGGRGLGENYERRRKEAGIQ